MPGEKIYTLSLRSSTILIRGAGMLGARMCIWTGGGDFDLSATLNAVVGIVRGAGSSR